MQFVLKNYFEPLEKQRKKLLDELRNLGPEQLNKSRNNKWSVGQIVGHLITAEELSIGYINKKINAINNVGNTGLWGELKLLAFIVSQRLPLKYKAPAYMGELPKSYADVQALAADWDATRAGLKKLLEKFPADGLKKKIYRHPVMGRCNMVHGLIFFREHIIHHYPQIQRQL